MPRVKGFLRIIKRGRPGHPDIGLPDEPDVDPDYGIDEGAGIDNELPELPSPPPGIWPPLTPENPWRPIDPGYGLPGPRPPTVGGGPARPPVTPGHPGQPLPETPEVMPPMVMPPGAIWPPLPPGVHGKFLALVLIGGMGHGVKYRYVVVDADARPPRPVDPDYGLEGPPPREPKK